MYNISNLKQLLMFGGNHKLVIYSAVGLLEFLLKLTQQYGQQHVCVRTYTQQVAYTYSLSHLTTRSHPVKPEFHIISVLVWMCFRCCRGYSCSKNYPLFSLNSNLIGIVCLLVIKFDNPHLQAPPYRDSSSPA